VVSAPPLPLERVRTKKLNAHTRARAEEKSTSKKLPTLAEEKAATGHDGDSSSGGGSGCDKSFQWFF